MGEELKKVEQLRPGTSGHTLLVKVVDAKPVLQKGRSEGPQGRQMRLSECLVGDDTAMIVFTARGDQGCNIPKFLQGSRSGSPHLAALALEEVQWLSTYSYE